jgi:hypothetical protein
LSVHLHILMLWIFIIYIIELIPVFMIIPFIISFIITIITSSPFASTNYIS